MKTVTHTVDFTIEIPDDVDPKTLTIKLDKSKIKVFGCLFNFNENVDGIHEEEKLLIEAKVTHHESIDFEIDLPDGEEN